MKYKRYYVDTNVFLYRVDKKSEYYAECRTFLHNASQSLFEIVTSTETVQEIVHVSQRLGFRKQGLEIAKLLIQQCKELIAIDTAVTIEFLKDAAKYPSAESRDLIHVAVCRVHGIKPLVTFDRDFRGFKEITTVRPRNVE